MNILHIIDSMGLGGTQTVIKGIFESQKENKNIYFYSLRKKEINIKIKHKNIFGYNSFSKFSLIPIFKLRKLIKENNIKVLHCHLAKSQIFGAIIKTLFFPKIKLIFHEHGKIFNKGKIYPFLMNLFIKKVDLYLAVSKATKNKIIEKTAFSENKVKVLYNFVDLDKFKKIKNIDIKKERKKYGLKQKDFVIGFAGRLVKRKGWENFIDSAIVLTKKGYNLKYLIVGDGEDREKLLKKIKGINNITFLGYNDDMQIFYNLLDCFVIPSYWEPMGLTQLEAQSCGCSLISSNVEGLNETVNKIKDCLLFELKDSDNLSEKIIKIYKEKELREKLIKGGFENVKNFSLERYLIKLNKIYEKL